jgi:hypothetical protein
MKLPPQAPAVVRGSVSWPMRQPVRGSTEPAIKPAAAGAIVNCMPPTPNTCVCDNGIATCCKPDDRGCTVDPGTGNCTCVGRDQ